MTTSEGRYGWYWCFTQPITLLPLRSYRFTGYSSASEQIPIFFGCQALYTIMTPSGQVQYVLNRRPGLGETDWAVSSQVWYNMGSIEDAVFHVIANCTSGRARRLGIVFLF